MPNQKIIFENEFAALQYEIYDWIMFNLQLILIYFISFFKGIVCLSYTQNRWKKSAVTASYFIKIKFFLGVADSCSDISMPSIIITIISESNICINHFVSKVKNDSL